MGAGLLHITTNTDSPSVNDVYSKLQKYVAGNCG